LIDIIFNFLTAELEYIMKERLKKKRDEFETFLTRYDNFGEDMHHYYEGEKKLKTRCGGCCTLVMNLWLLFVAIWYLTMMFTHELQDVQ